MSSAPVRLARIAFAGLSGAIAGFAEAARVVAGGRLWMADVEVLLLLVAGAGAGIAVAVPAGIALAAMPVKPLGRSRWMGFVGGLWAFAAVSVAVPWFSDPAPFTDPFPGQGSVVAFAGIVAVSVIAALALYQGVRGARAVAGGATVVALGLGAWVIAGQQTLPPGDSAAAGAPNVLLVTLDTVRADHFGTREVDTRRFDALAAEGARFTRASAVAAVTGPSHASMLSGAGPWEHGVLLNGVPLPEDRKLLAEILHGRGYQTAAFVSAYVLDGSLGFDRGFDVYDDDFGWLKGGSRLLLPRVLAMAARHAAPEEVLERRGADTVELALRWMAGRPGPWFVWVHLFDPHGPYLPPPPFDTRYYAGDPRDPANTSMAPVENVAAYLKPSLDGITDLNWVRAQYAGEISYTDAQLGRLLDAVDASGTLVAVMGDHGESLGEHGVWFNHGDDVYETSVHVPFAMRWPGKVPVGVVTAPVEGTDLTPTLLGLLGLPPVAGSGRSAFAEPREFARSMCYDRAANVAERAAGRITKPRWRMAGLGLGTARYAQRELDGSASWFDLTAEAAGVRHSDGPAELLNRLRGEANHLFESDTSRSAVDLSVEERARLEALGYTE